jgi:hypothetical protein
MTPALRTALAVTAVACTAAVAPSAPAAPAAPARAQASLRTAPSGLRYSSVSGRTIQRQPPARSCHALGAGVYARPDPRCTPGALNPLVTQATIGSTICRAGWTATVRPPESVTEPEKLASMAAYGVRGASSYEYDHDVPLELGGAVNDPRNLWPEPDYPQRAGFYANPKDRLENALKRLVCEGAISLAVAQRAIAADWVAAYHRYG